MRYLLLAGALFLVACGTPQERCIARAGKDLRVVEGLIETARGNLLRGYAIETRTEMVNTVQVCGQTTEGEDILCEIAVAKERQVPVAIDLEEEQRKLDTLRARRDELILSRDRTIAQCRAQFPES